jgi:flagellar M-ring protein FliF
MNDFLQRVMERVRTLWGQWKLPQKLIFFGVIGVTLLAVVLLLVFSAAPAQVPLISQPPNSPKYRLGSTKKVSTTP